MNYIIKKICYFLLLILSNNLLSQNLNLNNSIGFNYQDNLVKNYNGNINSTNSFEIKSLTITNSLNENITYNNKITQHEFANKLIINWSKDHHMIFLTNQSNYSLSRNLNFENLVGSGYGRRDSIFGIKINYSIGLLYNKINNQNLKYLRYSFRLKISQVKKKYNWVTEFYYQPDILDKNNLTVYGVTKFNLKLNNNLSFNITDVYNYYKISKVKLIHTLAIGLNYSVSKIY